MKSLLVALYVLMLGWAPTLTAAEMVEFSADVKRSRADGPVSMGRMMVSRAGIRTEVVQDNQAMVLIFRPADRVVWTLSPQDKRYLEEKGLEMGRPPLPDEPGSLCQQNIPEITCKSLGPATIQGRQTIRWEVTLKNTEGKLERAYLWADPRLRIIIREEHPSGMIMEMINIREGAQPPELFTVPAGYTLAKPSQPPRQENRPTTPQGR